MLNLQNLTNFRQSIYSHFSTRRDASMNLLDALSSYGHRCKNAIELCESPYFEREYSSITDAIADGLSAANWTKITQMIYLHSNETKRDRVVLITDTTPQPRMSAKCVADRHVTYSPNPAPGNKPITIGHEFSTVSLLPTDNGAQEKHWLLPLDTKRVKSHEKGNEVGMRQIKDCMTNLSLQDTLVISVADSKYGTENCRKQVSQHKNWVHLFRFNSTRNLYSQPETKDHTSGNIKRYGKAMKLNDSLTHIAPSEIVTQSMTLRSGKSYQFEIKVWRNQLLRGSKSFKGYEHPLTLIQIRAVDKSGKLLYKKPLWLGVAGERRHEISAIDACHYYNSRYDIEHYFRFGKEKLLFDQYQTPDVQHEEDWWRLTALAYSQLYMASKQVSVLPKKWERYLPIFQQARQSTTATPTQTQRGFYMVLDKIGTPAKPCKPRGNPTGRNKGELQDKRTQHPVIFKNTQMKSGKKKTLKDSGKRVKNSDCKKIEDLISVVKSSLNKMNFTTEKFYQLLKKTA